MKKILAYIAASVLLASLAPAVASADLQCYDSANHSVSVQNANQCYGADGYAPGTGYLLDTSTNTWTNAQGSVSGYGAIPGGCPVINGTQTVPAGVGVVADKCVDSNTGALYNYTGQRVDMNGTPISASEPTAASQSTPTPSATANTLTYTPLEPLPGGTPTTYSSTGAYFALLYKIALAVGAMVAIVSVVFAGITYMVSEAIDKKSEARRRLSAAAIGGLVMLGSWIILNTINPNLVQFNLSLPGQTNAGGSSSATINAQNIIYGTPQNPPTQAQTDACTAQGKSIHDYETGWICL